MTKLIILFSVAITTMMHVRAVGFQHCYLLKAQCPIDTLS